MDTLINTITNDGFGFADTGLDFSDFRDPHNGGKMHTAQSRQIWEARISSMGWFRQLGEAFYGVPVFLSLDVPLGYVQKNGKVHRDSKGEFPDIPGSLQAFLGLEDARGACTAVVPEEISRMVLGTELQTNWTVPDSESSLRLLEGSLVTHDLRAGEVMIMKETCYHCRARTGAGRRKNLCVAMAPWTPERNLTILANGFACFVTGAPTDHKGVMHGALGALRFKRSVAEDASWYKELLQGRDSRYTGKSEKAVVREIAQELADIHLDMDAMRAWCAEREIPPQVLEFLIGA